jgi:perosamine synthetase
MIEHIPIAGPFITELEVQYVADAAKNGWYSNASLYTERFEAEMAAYVDRKYALALPSCTSALHLSLVALGIGAGDEVIVPDITWIASAAPISYTGAIPVFADIDPNTWCITADSIEQKISDKTKAIMVVDLYGGMPDMDEILAIASRLNIPVIEDAAEAIGSEYKNKKAGSFGTFSAFSFHGTKTLTTGEGGMLLTDDQELYDRCKILCDHGRDPEERELFFNKEVAFKYKMSNLQAAMGLGQLKRIDDLVAKKRELFSLYYEELYLVEGLTLNFEPNSTLNTYWMTTVMLDPALGFKKQEIIQRMAKSKISCRPFFHPLSTIPAFSQSEQAKRARVENTVAIDLSPYGVNLPSAMNLTKENVVTVCERLKNIIGHK